MAKQSLGERLKIAREAAGLTMEALGKMVGVTPQAVYRWEHGTARPNTSRLQSLASALRISVNFLLTGIESPVQIVPISGREGRRIVPILREDDAVARRIDREIGSAETHFPCSDHAYIVVVWDGSNAPRLQRGDQVVIDPTLKPEPGDIVLAAVGNPTRPVLAKYSLSHFDRTSVPVLQHLNPDWSQHVLETLDHGYVVGVMTEHASPRRR